MPVFINSNEYVETGDHEVIKQNVYDSEFGGIELKKLSCVNISEQIERCQNF